MEKVRRESISGQMRAIGGKLRGWRKKSFVGLGFFGRKRTPQLPKKDQLDEIALLEQLVHEDVPFDWDAFETQRQASMFVKQANTSPNPHTLGQKSMTRDPSYRVFHELSLPKALDEPPIKADKSPEESDAEEQSIAGSVQVMDELSDVETVASVASIVHRPVVEDAVSNITGEGKEKLRFIIEFAKNSRKSHNLNSRLTRAPAANLDDPIELTKSRLLSKAKMHHRLSMVADTRSHRRSSKTSKQASLKRRTSALLKETRSNVRVVDKFERQRMKRSQHLEDQFAQYKGFNDAAHMLKHLERVRGFEELRNETQIELMARENGYKPERSGRFSSILSHLDTTGDLMANLSKDEDIYSAESSDEALNEADGGDLGEDEGETESEFSKQLYNFMDSEMDDIGLLAAEWDKVEGFNEDSDSESDSGKSVVVEDSEAHKSKYGLKAINVRNRKQKEEEKAQRRQRAIRNGWESTRKNYERENTKRRDLPQDSMTIRQFAPKRLMHFETA